MAIGVMVKATAKRGEGRVLLELIEQLIADVRTEPGNELAVVMRDPSLPDEVHVFEIYRDEEAIEAHRIAAHTVEKGPDLRALYAKPIEFRLLETVDWPIARRPDNVV